MGLLWLTAVLGCAQQPASSPRSLAELTAVAVLEDAPGMRTSWPGWRGGARGGVAHEGEWPVQWGHSEGVVWRVPAHSGNSSPIVWEEQVFLTGQRRDGLLSIMSFEFATGRLQWERTAPTTEARTHQRNGHASATPATDGRIVVAPLGERLYAWDLAGQPVWECPLGQVTHRWGAASSPVFAGGLVLQLCDGRESSELLAIEASSGEVRWRAARQSEGGWTTPAVLRDASGTPRQVVVNGTSGEHGEPGLVCGYDLATGRCLWQASGTADIPCPTAIVQGDWVVSSTGSNGPLMALRPPQAANPQLAAQSAAIDEAPILWRHASGGAQVPTGLCVDDALFVLGDGGILASYTLETGDVRWRLRLRGKFTASLVAAGDLLYALNEQGQMFVVSLEQQKVVAENAIRESCFATPAASAGRLVLRSDSHLWCVGRQGTLAAGASPSDGGFLDATLGTPAERATAAGGGRSARSPLDQQAQPSALQAAPASLKLDASSKTGPLSGEVSGEVSGELLPDPLR